MSAARPPGRILLYVLHCGNFYGTERMALATLEGMTGYERRVVVAPPPWDKSSVASAAEAAGHDTVTFRSRWGLVRALLPWFRRYPAIDVIGTGVVHTFACDLLARLFGVRLRQLHVAHGGTPTSFDQKRRLNHVPVTVVAVSDFVRNELVERGVRPERIAVIDNFLSDAQRDAGVQRPRYDLPPPAGRQLDRAAVRVAVVSRLDPIKRIDLVLDAVERHALGEFRFDIYGTGTELARLKSRAAGIPNIVFHGYVPDIENRLRDADLLLQLCPVEPFGLAVLEAFLARLVVVVPTSGGSSGLVEDGVSGFKFGSDDADDLARVLHQVRDFDPAQLQQFADAGAAALATRYSQAAGARRYASALERAGAG